MVQQLSLLLFAAALVAGCGSNKGVTGVPGDTGEVPSSIEIQPASADNYWPDGQIPVQFEEDISAANQQVFMDTCNNYIASQANLNCVNYSGQQDFVVIHSNPQSAPILREQQSIHFAYNYGREQQQRRCGNQGGANHLFIAPNAFNSVTIVYSVMTMAHSLPEVRYVDSAGILSQQFAQRLHRAYPKRVHSPKYPRYKKTNSSRYCKKASSDSDGDGWGWERGGSCEVIGAHKQRQRVRRQTSTHKNPNSGHKNHRNNSKPNRNNNGNNGGKTAPYCQSSGSDHDGDGWGWENNRSCIVKSTQSNGKNPVCNSVHSDPDGDGWGWENNRSCIVKSTQTNGKNPVCKTAHSDPDGDGWGWENNRSCVVNGATPSNTTTQQRRRQKEKNRKKGS